VVLSGAVPFEGAPVGLGQADVVVLGLPEVTGIVLFEVSAGEPDGVVVVLVAGEVGLVVTDEVVTLEDAGLDGMVPLLGNPGKVELDG
jgi:hypothetical protein